VVRSEPFQPVWCSNVHCQIRVLARANYFRLGTGSMSVRLREVAITSCTTSVFQTTVAELDTAAFFQVIYLQFLFLGRLYK
jgi:hypothetical protein